MFGLNIFHSGIEYTEKEWVLRKVRPYPLQTRACLSLAHPHHYFSAQGHVVISICIDLHDFWMYENREFSLLTDVKEPAESSVSPVPAENHEEAASEV